MKEFMVIPQGFSGLPMGEEFITTAENKKNTETVIEDWMLGPENPSNELRVLRQQHHDAG